VLTQDGQSVALTFTADRPGEFGYTGQIAFCGEHNHQHMVGEIVVEPG